MKNKQLLLAEDQREQQLSLNLKLSYHFLFAGLPTFNLYLHYFNLGVNPTHSIHAYEIFDYPHCSINAMNFANVVIITLIRLLLYQILFKQAIAINFKKFVNAIQL